MDYISLHSEKFLLPSVEQKIKNDRVGEVRQQLKLQTSINLLNEASQSGLMIACKYKALKTVKLYLKESADVNLTDTDAWTALHYAAQSGLLEIVELLIKKMR